MKLPAIGLILTALTSLVCARPLCAQTLMWQSPTTTSASQEALQAAQRPINRAVAAKSFCYCGCDREHGHQNLLDCYRTGHIPICKTCQDEFNRINQLTSKGQSLSQIQNQIDSEFGSRYPFPQPSAILKRYLSSKRSQLPM